MAAEAFQCNILRPQTFAPRLSLLLCHEWPEVLDSANGANGYCLNPHHETSLMALGDSFSFALERDHVRARRCHRLGWSDYRKSAGSDRRNLFILNSAVEHERGANPSTALRTCLERLRHPGVLIQSLFCRLAQRLISLKKFAQQRDLSWTLRVEKHCLRCARFGPRSQRHFPTAESGLKGQIWSWRWFWSPGLILSTVETGWIYSTQVDPFTFLVLWSTVSCFGAIWGARSNPSLNVLNVAS